LPNTPVGLPGSISMLMDFKGKGQMIPILAFSLTLKSLSTVLALGAVDHVPHGLADHGAKDALVIWVKNTVYYPFEMRSIR